MLTVSPSRLVTGKYPSSSAIMAMGGAAWAPLTGICAVDARARAAAADLMTDLLVVVSVFFSTLSLSLLVCMLMPREAEDLNGTNDSIDEGDDFEGGENPMVGTIPPCRRNNEITAIIDVGWILGSIRSTMYDGDLFDDFVIMSPSAFCRNHSVCSACVFSCGA